MSLVRELHLRFRYPLLSASTTPTVAVSTPALSTERNSRARVCERA